MSQLTFNCPHCGAKLTTIGARAGTRMQCSDCDRPLEAPSWRELISSSAARLPKIRSDDRLDGVHFSPPVWLLAGAALLGIGSALVSLTINSLAQSRAKSLINLKRERTREVGQFWIESQSRGGQMQPPAPPVDESKTPTKTPKR